jgi:fibronectin type 3 domain-containing protein
MKRILSSVLAIVMMVSVFSVLTVTASAAEDASKYQVTTTGFKNGEITFNISLAPDQTIYDAMVSIKFDKTAVSVKAGGPATTTDSDGNKVDVVDGLHASGISYYNDSCYTFAYTTSKESGYKIGSTAKSIFTITFKALNANVAPSFSFYAGDNDSTTLIKEFKNVSQLATPEIASATSNANSVVLTWKAVTGAKQYKIYKQNGSTMSVVATVGADVTSYEDKAVEQGKSYTYGVSAVDNANGETSYKTIKVTHKLPELKAPVISSAKATTSGVKVVWGAVEGAAKYNVYRKVYNPSTKKWDKSWKAVKTGLTTTEYVDGSVTLGTQYKYLVKAVNGDLKKNSAESSVVTFKISPTPQAYIKSNGIKIKWSTVVSAESYIIYRAEYNDSKGKYNSYKKMTTVNGSTKEWTDTKATSGKKYKYCLKAVKGSVVCSKAQSNSMYFLTKTTVKAAKAKTGVKVSWTEVKGATSFKIYRSELQNGAWTKFSQVGTAKSNVKSFTDTTVVSGVQYKYKVKAIKSKTGQTSSETAAYLYLAAPKVTAVKGTDCINVTWTESAGATEYVVYRSTYDAKKKKWSSFKKQTTTNATTTSYKDTKAKSGTKYKYCVKAKNGSVVSAYLTSKSVKR